MKLKDLKQKESQIQNQVIKYLTLLERTGQLFFFRAGSGLIRIQNPSGKDRYFKTGKAGCPDIVCCAKKGKGLFIGLEIKTEKGTQTAKQKEAQKQIENCGGKYYIIRSLKDIEEIFKG